MSTIKPRKCSYIGALCVPNHPELPRFVFISRHRDKAEQLRLIRCNKGNAPVQQWITRLNALGFAPSVVNLAQVPIGQEAARKAIWIRLLIQGGHVLYNVGSEGGRRRRPSIHTLFLRDRIIRERKPKAIWARSLVTIRRQYLNVIAGR